MIEKHCVGDQPRHRDDLPPCRRHQPRIELAIIGNSRLFEPQHIDAAQKGLGRTARQHVRLTRKEAVPHRMFVGRESIPVLRDRPVGRCARRRGFMDVGIGVFHAREPNTK